MASGSDDVHQLPTRWSGQDSIEDFLLDQRRHGRNVRRAIKQAHQPDGRIKQLRCSGVHHDAALAAYRLLRPLDRHAAHKVEQLFAVDRKPDAKMRYFLARFHHTPGNRQVERGQKIVTGPVIDGVRSQ